MSRSFYDLIFLRKMEDVYGLDPVPVFNNSGEEYGDLLVFAMAFNKGSNGTENPAKTIFNTNKAATVASSDWISDGIWSDGYAIASTHYATVLSNDYTPANSNDLQQWLGWRS
ncbi:MAG: hypothetical protein GY813_20220, partial [Halieaceae bacterium]|nr:hypothetical protein [Halieaceae bacterium]